MELVLVPVLVNHQLINSFNPSPTTHVSPLNCHIAWPSFPTHYDFTPFPFHDLVHAREIVVQHVHFLQILGVKRAPERCAPSNSFNLWVGMTPGRDRQSQTLLWSIRVKLLSWTPDISCWARLDRILVSRALRFFWSRGRRNINDILRRSEEWSSQ